MALNTRISTTLANAQLDAVNALANNGKIRIYDGAQPATPETAIGAQVMLSESVFGATAFGAASGKVITAAAIAGVAIAASGTAAWCRILKSDGTTVLFDGTVGTSASNIIVDSATFTAAVTLNINSLTLTLPMQGA